jgi:hypothetical protein
LTIFLGVGGAAVVVFVLAMRHWNHVHSKDLGTMSRQWLAEYNAQHP